eukprot:COSAG06_NODE_19387_length_840_cov_9.140351_2_plen_134_part_01
MVTPRGMDSTRSSWCVETQHGTPGECEEVELRATVNRRLARPGRDHLGQRSSDARETPARRPACGVLPAASVAPCTRSSWTRTERVSWFRQGLQASTYVLVPQVAEAVGAGEVIGGSWSSILFSLDVAVGLWPL